MSFLCHGVLFSVPMNFLLLILMLLLGYWFSWFVNILWLKGLIDATLLTLHFFFWFYEFKWWINLTGPFVLEQMDLDAKRFGRGKNAGMMRGFIDCFFYLWAWPAVKFYTVEKWYIFFTWKVLYMPSSIEHTNYYLYWHLSKMLLNSFQFISSCVW